jgi:uncharacterized protein (TIGR02271 family)
MSVFEGIFGNSDNPKKEATDDAKLLLRKENLDITKSKVQKGEVEFGKEIIEEQRTVDVPVSREEVVIERRTLNNEASDTPITSEETMRIPVSEEIVNVNKKTVVTGEISAHKRSIEDTKHIDETLKREEAIINKTGNPDIVDSGTTED